MLVVVVVVVVLVVLFLLFFVVVVVEFVVVVIVGGGVLSMRWRSPVRTAWKGPTQLLLLLLESSRWTRENPDD